MTQQNGTIIKGILRKELVSPYPWMNKVVRFEPKPNLVIEEEQAQALALMEAYLFGVGVETTQRYYKDATPRFYLYALISIADDVRRRISKQTSRYGVIYRYQGIGDNFRTLADIPPSIFEEDLEMMELRGEG